jgi:rhamnosyltransferase
MNPSPFTVSVVIPTWMMGVGLTKLVERLRKQTMPPLEIIVIDSSSPDTTAQIAQELGCRVEVIAKQDFNHGGTRNRGARLAQGEILVFMTQDALPVNEGFLEALLKPLILGEAAAAYARQLPYPDASPLEVFARSFNYPARSHVQTLDDLPKKGFKAFFYSDVASAIRRETFWAAGGYPEWVIMDEDVYLCATLLRAGQTVAYCAEALVWHSHNYTLKQQFSRLFDAGVFVQQAGAMLEGARVGGEGLRFVLSQLSYLARSGNWTWVPRGLLEAVVKYVAFQLGRHHVYLPRNINRALSMNKAFWDSP